MPASPNSDGRPIGVFDSGLGGLSVLDRLQAQLPSERFVYVADQARAPYGDLDVETVRSYAVDVVDHLLDTHDAKAVVVACNTASEAALNHLRGVRPAVPFVGMEPAVKPAAERSRSGKIGVLATTRTVEGDRLASIIDRHAAGVTVVAQACPGLVELVEDGLFSSPLVDRLVASYVRPLVDAGVDTIVLGCSHFSFLTEAIERIAGQGVEIVDPAAAVAKQTWRVIAPASDPISPTTTPVRYETSSDPVRMRAQLREILGIDTPTFQAPRWPRAPG